MKKIEEEKKKEGEKIGFIDYGSPAALATNRGAIATCDANSHPLILICAMDDFNGRLRTSLIVLDVETGKTDQYWYPNENTPLGEDYAVLLSSKNYFYVMFGNKFLEFDINLRKWTFAGDGPGMAMSFTENDEGIIYAATYPGSHLISFNPKTREFINYGQMDPQEKYPRALACDRSGWVYCGTGMARGNLVAFNPQTKEKIQIPKEEERKPGSGDTYRGVDGNVYGHSGDNKWYQLFEGKATPLQEKPYVARMPIKTGTQGTIITDFPDGRKIVQLNLPEKWVKIREKTGKIKHIDFDYKCEGLIGHFVARGTDGRIYGSTALPLHFYVFDPQTNFLEDWGLSRYSAQLNAITSYKNYIFGAGYSGGEMHMYDITKPWNNQRGKNPNPRLLGSWPKDLCRPTGILVHPDGKHVIMTGWPEYGACGGGMVIYDITTDTYILLTHQDIIPYHSTYCIRALPNGDLIGGTTISPGSGGHAVATEAELYIMDWKTKRVTFHFVPFPGKGNISDIEIGPDGLVYGFADGPTFFVFDPDKKQIIHEENLSKYGSLAGAQAPRVIYLGPDNNFYIIFRKAIVQIEPKTFKHTKLFDTPVAMQAGVAIQNGRVYLNSGSHLCSCKIEGLPSQKTEDIGWTYLRSNWTDQATFLAMQTSSSPMGRSHYDQNNFVVNVAGNWIITDSEYRDLKYEHSDTATKTINHNTILVDGIGQDKVAGGKREEFFQSPYYSYALGDATNSYPSDKMSKFLRHIIYLRPNYFLIFDQLESPNPAKFTWLLHTDSLGRMNLKNNFISIKKKKAELNSFILKPDKFEVKINEGEYGPYASVSNLENKKEMNFLSFICSKIPEDAFTEEKGVIKLIETPIFESSGKENFGIVVENEPGLFYRGQTKGDFFTFEIPVSKEDDYEIEGRFFKNYLYGIVQLSIDGKKLGEPYDGYDVAAGLSDEISFGKVHLSEGKHYFKFEIIGKNQNSGNYFINVVSLTLKQPGERKEEVEEEKLNLKVQAIEEKNIIGAEIKDEQGIKRILFNTGEKDSPLPYQEQTFSGMNSLISLSLENEIDKYALYKGNLLKYKDKTLFSSQNICSVSLGWQNKNIKGTIELSKEEEIQVYAPNLKKLLINNVETNIQNLYDANSGLLKLKLKEGIYNIGGDLS